MSDDLWIGTCDGQRLVLQATQREVEANLWSMYNVTSQGGFMRPDMLDGPPRPAVVVDADDLYAVLHQTRSAPERVLARQRVADALLDRVSLTADPDDAP